MKSNFIHKVVLLSLIINVVSVLMINGYYKYYYNSAEDKAHVLSNAIHLKLNKVSRSKLSIVEMEEKVKVLYSAWVDASDKLLEEKFHQYKRNPENIYLELLQESEAINEKQFHESIENIISKQYVANFVQYRGHYDSLPQKTDKYLEGIIDMHFSGFLIRIKKVLDEDEFQNALKCAELIASYQKTNYKAAIPYLSCFMKQMNDIVKKRELENNLDHSLASNIYWVVLDDCLKEYCENYSLGYHPILKKPSLKSAIDYDLAKSYFRRLIEE